MSERALRFTCFNCGDDFERSFKEKYRVGQYGRMSDGHVHRSDVVCFNQEGYGTYGAIDCPTCKMKGPHDIQPAE